MVGFDRTTGRKSQTTLQTLSSRDCVKDEEKFMTRSRLRHGQDGSPPMPGRASSLLRQLSSAIGAQAAAQEFKWLSAATLEKRSPRLPPLPPLAEMVARRVAGEPLQYILGTQPFGPLELLVRPPTLIPRPETEEWTLRIAEELRPAPGRTMRLLDICTGSGCIPLTLCHLWPKGSTHALAVDISSSALGLATDNAAECQVALSSVPDACQNTLSLLQADVLAPAFVDNILQHGPFDIVTSNPPYIPLNEYRELSSSVSDWEDPRALLGDPEDLPRVTPSTSQSEPSSDGKGLTFYRALARLMSSPDIMRPHAPLVMEVGAGQAKAVRGLLEHQSTSHGPAFARTETWMDAFGIERAVIGWRSDQ